jgi:tetratricopeptide (TPR) repeat protein
MRTGIVVSCALLLTIDLACGATADETTATPPGTPAGVAAPRGLRRQAPRVAPRAGGARRGRPAVPAPPPPPPPPPDPRLEQARTLFMDALCAFETEDYPTAIEKFRAANELSPRPEILFNIAVCQERLGDPAAALASYRQYLAVDPDMPVERRRETEDKVRELELQLGVEP